MYLFIYLKKGSIANCKLRENKKKNQQMDFVNLTNSKF